MLHIVGVLWSHDREAMLRIPLVLILLLLYVFTVCTIANSRASGAS